jgi:GT2 family glycosyltransferase
MITRLACKAYEYACRGFTSSARWAEADPTTILLDHQTPAQLAAAATLTTKSASVGRLMLIVMPFRDRWDLTAACIESLRMQQLPAGVRVRLLLIDNGSTESATRDGLQALQAKGLPPWGDVKVLRIDEAFNYSRLINIGVKSAADFSAPWLFLLNNDVTLQRPTDLGDLLDFADTCPRLGALGCTLCYPDGRIQHLFAAPGVKVVAAHPFKGRRLAPDLKWFAAPRPVAAVTGAAMLVAAKAFAAVGGLNEDLPTVGQDIDLCLKLQRQGLVNWTLPSVRLVHHEGASRGGAINKEEVRRMYATWGRFLVENPFYSQRFSRFSETPAYALGAPRYPWERLLP